MGKWSLGSHFVNSNGRGHHKTRNLKDRRSDGPTIMVPGTAALGLPPGLPRRDRAHSIFRKRAPVSSSGAFIRVLGMQMRLFRPHRTAPGLEQSILTCIRSQQT